MEQLLKKYWVPIVLTALAGGGGAGYFTGAVDVVALENRLTRIETQIEDMNRRIDVLVNQWLGSL